MGEWFCEGCFAELCKLTLGEPPKVCPVTGKPIVYLEKKGVYTDAEKAKENTTEY